MSLCALPHSARDLIVEFLYEPEGYPHLRLLGRLAIHLADVPLLTLARGAFQDLCQRRDDLLREEGDWVHAWERDWTHPGASSSLWVPLLQRDEGDWSLSFSGDLDPSGYWVDTPIGSHWVEHRAYDH